MDDVTELHSETMALFQGPPGDSTVQSRQWVDYRPVSLMTEGSALEFNVPASPSDYIDLKKTVLQIKARVTRLEGTPITDTDNVSPINLTLQTMFSQVDLSLQQQPLYSVGPNYGFKAYLDCLLDSSPERQDELTSQLYYKDTPEPDAGLESDSDGSNNGLYLRSRFTKNGKVFDMSGPLYLDMMQQGRMLLNGVPLHLKLWPSKDSFRLMSPIEGASYKLSIVDATLSVCMVKVQTGVIIAHNNVLKDSPALYPLNKSTIKTYSLSAGQFDFGIDNVFQGEIPDRLILGLVSSEAFSGSYKKNPFSFKPHNCNFVAFSIDGQTVPGKPLTPNYDTGNYAEAFQTLHQVKPVPISRNDYPRGYCLYALNLSDSRQTSLKKTGHSRLVLKFSKALVETVTLVVYGKSQGLVQIDAARNVMVS